MTERGQLYALIGLPRSGKTSYSRTWLTTPGPRPRVVLHADAFRMGLHGGIFFGEAEGMMHACLDTAARALLLSKYDVLIDDTATTQSTIWRYLHIDRDVIFHWIDTPVWVCLERATPPLIPVIYQLNRQLEELAHNWHEKITRWRQQVRYRQSCDSRIDRGG